MKPILLLTALYCVSLMLAEQPFEGEIVYQNTLKSKIPGTSDRKLTDLFGAVQEYFIRGGDYKSISNGTFSQWQLYRNAENRLYNKNSTSDTIYWDDAGFNNNKVLQTEIRHTGDTIAGYSCDELIMTCTNGIETYYFSSKLAIDTTAFGKHLYGHWNEYVAITHSLPLKMIISFPQFDYAAVAVAVKPMHLENKFFELPYGAVVQPRTK